MSNEKYAGLPDIDTAADVYESNEIAFENNDPYDSDDSLLRLQQRSHSQGQKGDQSKDAGANGGLDEGHLPSRGQVGKKFGRSKGLGLGVNKSSYTYRPHSHSNPFSSSLFASTSNLTSASSSSDSDDLFSDEEGPNADRKADLNIDQLGPAPLPSGKIVTTHKSKSRLGKQPRFREEPSSRLRRLKREMMEVERQIQAQAQAQASTSNSTSAQAEPSVQSTSDPINRRRKAKPKPTPQAMMTQLLQLKSGLTTLEDRADDLILSGVKVDERKRREREQEGRGLLEKMEGQSAGVNGKTVKQQEGVEGRAVSKGVMSGVDDVTELDRRLEELERRVGTGSTTAVEIVNPILPTLDRLESIVALLSQPNQLDAASRRIKFLLNDLDKVSAPQITKPGQSTSNKQQERPSDETDVILSTTDLEKINALYSLLPRIDPLIPVVPALLTRLRSLSSLHASASSFQATVSQLQADAGKMKETDGEMKEVLEGLREGMRGQGEVMKGNWERLGERLKDVEERMAKLQSS